MVQLKLPSIGSKIAKGILSVSLLSVTAMFLILPYSLYKRDTEAAKQEAVAQIEIIRYGLLSTMMATADPVEIRKSVDGFKTLKAFEFRMVRSKYVRKQFGDRDGETARDKIEEDVLSGKIAAKTTIDGVILRHVSPFVADERCAKCHMGIDGKPIKVGMVIGLAEFIIDISDKKQTSIKLLAEILIEASLILLLLFFTIYRLINKHVITPLKTITDNVAKIEQNQFDISFPPSDSMELAILEEQVMHTAAVLKDLYEQTSAELEKAQKLNKKITKFANKQAAKHGISDKEDIGWIIDKFIQAANRYQEQETEEAIYQFVSASKKEICLPCNPKYIKPTSMYLTSIIPESGDVVTRQSIELALDEAIANAIIHGNLEVPSNLKDKSHEQFDAMILERRKSPNFKNRKTEISYSYKNRIAKYIIRDEGNGFNWQKFLKAKEVDLMQEHGRGVMIMRTFANSISYNEKGNELTITFDLSNSEQEETK